MRLFSTTLTLVAFCALAAPGRGEALLATHSDSIEVTTYSNALDLEAFGVLAFHSPGTGSMFPMLLDFDPGIVGVPQQITSGDAFASAVEHFPFGDQYGWHFNLVYPFGHEDGISHVNWVIAEPIEAFEFILDSLVVTPVDDVNSHYAASFTFSVYGSVPEPATISLVFATGLPTCLLLSRRSRAARCHGSRYFADRSS